MECRGSVPFSHPAVFFLLTFGQVGNQEWADFIDATQNVVRINNKDDPVPVIPPRLLGFHHSSGEIHIQDSGDFIACTGKGIPLP